MVNVVAVATELGYLNIPDNMLIGTGIIKIEIIHKSINKALI